MDNCNTYQLAISIVVYAGEYKLLHDTIKSLKGSLEYASKHVFLTNVVLVIIDNGPAEDNRIIIQDIIEGITELATQVISNKRNIGYGRGHNLCFTSVKSDYFLILNPDVIVDKKTITEAMKFMESNSKVGMLTPEAHSPSGEKLYLCKQYPSILNLLIRGFLSKSIQFIFKQRIAKYEMRSYTEEKKVCNNIPITSGCFMFLRGQAVYSMNGFSPEYFLYFEDFDLCIKLCHAGWGIAYVPQVSIIHSGGNASRKGFKHIIMFITSAYKFFNKHGWKLS